MSKVQTEDPRFVRDIHSKALLSTDKVALNRHRLERMAATKRQVEIDESRATQADHHEQLQQLKSTVDKIEKLIYKVLEKDNNGS
jgi:hypothetical protein|tara:strand:- start:4529 stop:4783 length:255 start_codon:yes stop_codon:yes gene_type:complete